MGTPKLAMSSGFAGLSLDEILGRLSKSGYDSACYRLLAKYHYPPQEVLLKSKEYERMGKSERVKRLRELAWSLRHSNRFRGDSLEEVILEGISEVDLPKKWFNTVFGHVNNEEKLYPLVRGFLKRKYYDRKVIETSDRRSRIGIRYADFTVVKKGFFASSIISVDVKVDVQAFDYSLNQASDFLGFSDEVYLLCTPGLIFLLGQKWGELTGVERTFTRKLEASRINLYVMDAVTHKVARPVHGYGSITLNNEKQRKALSELGFK